MTFFCYVTPREKLLEYEGDDFKEVFGLTFEITWRDPFQSGTMVTTELKVGHLQCVQILRRPAETSSIGLVFTLSRGVLPSML